ncbi:pantetheine-phosphate adenylyltransferase [Candidatus Blochmannia ocreatus (nom. nud.)]|uniref:Phosphopantetheine adenylyltransferase n=1 Tax=Candidatus Blochmannia ocreatus (nom. nud.) TaxID=251538 RepID=A0ABY4SYM6_9ENTR|nr:pantetheine-phosphate adenylyltransferase [Candidatus Blochmannia ocreatus]URJ25077.1 pantetheine-phosphate adenylyltransferase [Candidatus Blochmannia ocreatus]
MILKAIYPGTFDPLTYGHLDIITRARKIFSKIFLAVAENPQKRPLFSLKDRVMLAEKATSIFSNVVVFGFNDLTINIMRERQIKFIIRGLRTVADFEYERQLVSINNHLNSEIETVFMMSTGIWGGLSSKLIKEIAQCGGELKNFIPEVILEKVLERLKNAPIHAG